MSKPVPETDFDPTYLLEKSKFGTPATHRWAVCLGHGPGMVSTHTCVEEAEQRASEMGGRVMDRRAIGRSRKAVERVGPKLDTAQFRLEPTETHPWGVSPGRNRRIDQVFRTLEEAEKFALEYGGTVRDRGGRSETRHRVLDTKRIFK